MNGGAFGENFPYSNFHDLNMDWIIQIAKNFLDQYTNIQQTITEGLEGLDSKTQELKDLLQQWYDTHSNDIANQLADALQDLNDWYTAHQNYLEQTLIDAKSDFDTHANQKAQETLESIPTDYTNLYNTANATKDSVVKLADNQITFPVQNFIIGRLLGTGEVETPDSPGAYWPSRCRVVSENVMTYDYDINLNVVAGYLFSVVTLADPANPVVYDWRTSLSIGANTPFRICIRNNSESQETGPFLTQNDIYTFVCKVFFNNKTNEQELQYVYDNGFNTANGYAFYKLTDGFIIGRMIGNAEIDSTSGYWPATRRISSPTAFKENYPVEIVAEEGYQFGVFTSSDGTTYTDQGGWKTNFVVPKNTYYKLTIRKATESQSDPALTNSNIIPMLKKITHSSPIRYEFDSPVFFNPYIFNNNNAPFALHKQKFIIEPTGVYPPENESVGAISRQGFAVFNNVAFQAYNNGTVALVNLSDGTVIATFQNNELGHANAISFTNSYYDETDPYPLAIISDSSTTAICARVVRITNSALTILRTISLDNTQSGYYANIVYDSNNNCLLVTGYKVQSYTSDENNAIIISRWTNENTPTFIEKFEIPFMPYTQQPSYFNGNIIIISAYNGMTAKCVTVNPYSKQIVTSFNFPNPHTNGEIEGIDFQETDDMFKILIATNFGNDQFYICTSNI